MSPAGALRRTTCCKVSLCVTCQRRFRNACSRRCLAPMPQAARGNELHESEITGCRKLGRHRANTCAPLPARRRPRERQHVLQMRRCERGRDCSANGLRHELCARRKEGVGTQYASNAARCIRPRTFIAGPAAGG